MYLRILSTASAAALFLAAFAQPVAAQSIVYACAAPNGQLRVTAASQACRPSETRLSWNAAGSEGPQGPQGEMGPTGPQGPQGDIGPTGPQGPQGDIGPAGPQGEAGPAGADGAMGPRGFDGAQGPQGEAGPAGADGVMGIDGAQGPQGERGEAGPQGPQGEPGAAGPMGPQGVQGERGLQGEQGPAGPEGIRGLDGSEGPIGPPGPVGPAGPAGAALRVQHSWVGGFSINTQLEWTTVPASEITFTTEGGPLQISVDVSVTTTTNQTFSCRPIIGGVWAGLYGGHAYVDRWTEGTLTTYASVWTMWAKTRVYVGVPAGVHTLAIQCLRESQTATISVGHAVVPGSISVLEMH